MGKKGKGKVDFNREPSQAGPLLRVSSTTSFLMSFTGKPRGVATRLAGANTAHFPIPEAKYFLTNPKNGYSAEPGKLRGAGIPTCRFKVESREAP